MAIIVEEGLHPNGMDLVKEARLNGVARANAEPQRRVQALRIGEGYVVIGLSLEPVLSPSAEGEPEFAAVLSLVGGRESELMPTMPVKMVVGELCRLSLSDLRAKLAGLLDGPAESQ